MKEFYLCYPQLFWTVTPFLSHFHPYQRIKHGRHQRHLDWMQASNDSCPIHWQQFCVSLLLHKRVKKGGLAASLGAFPVQYHGQSAAPQLWHLSCILTEDQLQWDKFCCASYPSNWQHHEGHCVLSSQSEGHAAQDVLVCSLTILEKLLWTEAGYQQNHLQHFRNRTTYLHHKWIWQVCRNQTFCSCVPQGSLAQKAPTISQNLSNKC